MAEHRTHRHAHAKTYYYYYNNRELCEYKLCVKKKKKKLKVGGGGGRKQKAFAGKCVLVCAVLNDVRLDWLGLARIWLFEAFGWARWDHLRNSISLPKMR